MHFHFPINVGFLFFQKRLHAFFLIFSAETLYDRTYFQLVGAIQRQIITVIDRVFGRFSWQTEATLSTSWRIFGLLPEDFPEE